MSESTIVIVANDNAASIVGKNNSGKTSLFCIFNIFLSESGRSFSFEDFSLACHCGFIKAYKRYESITDENKEQKIPEVREEEVNLLTDNRIRSG